MLDLSNVGLSSTLATVVFHALRHETSLAQLILDRNRLTDDNCGHLAASCWAWPHLSRLSLASTGIRSAGAAAILAPKTPPGCTSPALGNLTVLDLSYNNLEGMDVTVLLLFLQRCSKLTSIGLEGCLLSPAVASSAPLRSALETAPALAQLSAGAAAMLSAAGSGRVLSAAFAVGHGMPLVLPATATAVERQLSALAVSHRYVEASVARVIAQVLDGSAQMLTSVRLCHCGMDDATGLLLLPHLRRIPTLECLTLAGNTLGQPFCDALAAWIADCAPLTSVDVSSCGLDRLSLSAFLTALAERGDRSPMRKLVARDNPVSSLAPSAVARLHSLQLLDLRDTGMGGCDGVARAWASCHAGGQSVVSANGLLLTASPRETFGLGVDGRGDNHMAPAPASIDLRTELNASEVSARLKEDEEAAEDEEWF